MNSNKKITLALTAIVIALAAVGYGAYQLGARKSVAAVAITAPAGKKPLYWHDPMVPGQRFDKPGKSPFMDMQLVPVYAQEGGGAADDGGVTISPRVEQNLGVRTATVTRGKLASGFSAIGNVAFNDRDVALVQARSSGFVERLYARAPLDPVRKGQALAEVYVPDWVAAQEEFLAARSMQGADTAGLVDGARQRMRLAGMSEGQIHGVESTGKVQARLTIVAPISGVIAELGAREGLTMAMGAPLFRINGLSTVWVNAEVPENMLGQLRPGDPVVAQAQALPGSDFKGKVSAILPEVNPTTRTATARIELANPGGNLLPGMFASVTFGAERGADVLQVPSEAVIQTGTRSVVMLAQAGGKFKPVDVETGSEGNGLTEIRKGLSEGQQVVISAQFLIDSEASLTGTETRMAGMDKMGGMQMKPATPAAASHHAEGKVEQIGKDSITISHGPIASLQWGPMTMGFKLPPTGLPANIKVGTQVAFDIKKGERGFDIITIAASKAMSMDGMKMPMAMPGVSK
ncbi:MULTISPECIES: efflux RND transporter periplasmic adaptor subunit [unclassified Janthinobacterium]|uniref:efflux RND transporter periplasmic adaptor subunit n=1 Tax=unclassified Janthinobacterium TaxID=2610881 RepID=UPI0016133706|nr:MULTISPECIES: efflux RND transporter periplasmic adaptor subunit [unclassified Janthinobacterium]MBB5370062.1 Cu(I)/Ag(I) efflux system membrane fusion protein [Janthinobacterium sp. K2C7]MBB5382868.1 Cu(I)/Ag(I) efflux system membrane fusion protein [Janthinobacterium sp. K2Li3]MBB5384853.1 Cu(I)/Ag(I) efflux system membrane fusion protein [Janthinobacterium sp. K2E3]